MREALSEIVLLTVKAGKSISCDVACGIIASKAKHALSAPPRACDVMSEDDLTKVVTDSFMKSLETRPEFNIGGIKTMVIAAISAAIKCAYDTQLVSKTEGATDGSK